MCVHTIKCHTITFFFVCAQSNGTSVFILGVRTIKSHTITFILCVRTLKYHTISFYLGVRTIKCHAITFSHALTYC